MPYPILNTTPHVDRHAKFHNAVIDVKAHFDAVGDGVADDSTAIQNAINAAATAKGGTVFFPPGKYKVVSTLTIGSAGAGKSGAVHLRGAGWGTSMERTGAAWLQGGGASGYGPILKIHNATQVSVTGVNFDGNNLSTACVHIEYDPADTSPASYASEHFRFDSCTFREARTHNVQINDSAGATIAGDVSLAVFDACYFAPSIAATTTAHVYQRSPNALQNSFYGCQFYGAGSGAYPQNAVKMASGSMSFFGCLSVLLGTVDFNLTAAANDLPPNVTVYGWESQSKNFMLYDSTGSTAAALRPTVLSGVFHSDIEAAGTYTIDWTAAASAVGPLVLEGFYAYYDITITGTVQRTYAHGVVFDTGKDFLGTGKNNITGSWSLPGLVFNQSGGGRDLITDDTDGSHWAQTLELDDATASSNPRGIGTFYSQNRTGQHALAGIEGVRKNSNSDWYGQLRFYTQMTNASNASPTSLTLAATLDHGGQLQLPVTGSGAGLSIGTDTTLYRSAADRLKTDDLIDATPMGVATFTKAGVPSDADWAVAPPIGTIAIDTTNLKIYVRTAAATWKSVTVA